MKKRRKFYKKLIGISVVIILLLVINFIPTWKLKTKDMQERKGHWINVYYETEADAAEDVFLLADSDTKEVALKLGFSDKQEVSIYIYDEQKTMQMKKYGFLGPLLKLDWYIGDNKGTNVILTSPANPGKIHDYNTIKSAVMHEVVHAYVSVLNPHIQLWLTEGMALYLANGEPFYKSSLEYIRIPSYFEIQTKNPIEFANMNGYALAHTYIEYLEITYGWNRVLELIKSEDYMRVFGISEKEIYDGWVDFIENYYR